jgi:homoserine kinase
MAAVFRAAKRRLPKLELICINRIPLARGLGSSAASYLSGLLAANRLLGDRFTRDEILAFGNDFEGHPDNMAPALYGGVRASAVWGNTVVSHPWPVPALRCVVAVPAFELATKKARAVLPKTVPLGDAVRNLSAVGLMAAAFESHPEWLKDILNDRLHEPYRAKLIPGFYSVRTAALKAGALGFTLSGAGPTVLAFSRSAQAAAVGAAMERAFRRHGVRSRLMNLSIDRRGARVTGRAA